MKRPFYVLFWIFRLRRRCHLTGRTRTNNWYACPSQKSESGIAGSIGGRGNSMERVMTLWQTELAWWSQEIAARGRIEREKAPLSPLVGTPRSCLARSPLHAGPSSTFRRPDPSQISLSEWGLSE